MQMKRAPVLYRVLLALATFALVGLTSTMPVWAADQAFGGENAAAIAPTAAPGTGPLIGVNPVSGGATATIPFELNAARGDIQPDIALHYTKDLDGEAGLGWSLAIPSIERKPLWGLPDYANDPGPPSALAHADRMKFQGEDLIPLGLVAPEELDDPDAVCEPVPPAATTEGR